MDCMTGQGHGDAHVLKALGQQRQVALDDRADIAVDDRGAGALVLLHFGQQVGGEGLDYAGGALGQYLSDILLVGRVGVGMEQAYCHGLDAAVQDGLDGAVYGGGVEGAQDFARGS